MLIYLWNLFVDLQKKTNNLQTNKKNNNNSSTASVMSDLVGQCPQPLSLNEWGPLLGSHSLSRGFLAHRRSPRIGMKIRNIWNHHLGIYYIQIQKKHIHSEGDDPGMCIFEVSDICELILNNRWSFSICQSNGEIFPFNGKRNTLETTT